MERINVPVAIIFFNRPAPLRKCFEAVREAKPTKLFLVQDGPRKSNQTDLRNVEECRKIVENVDWDCEVVRIYSEENLGCGKRIYTGIKEVFNHVDRVVILEDDIVASKDFFYFASEMLEKYKDDERIIDIAGMNHCGVNTSCPYSYFFSEIGSCWGWATWKRSWDLMEYNFDFINDEYAVNCFMKSYYRSKKMRKNMIKESKKRREILKNGGRLTAWTHQFMMAGYFQSTLSIVPKMNLVSNIGLTEDSGHATSSIKKIPKGLQRVFFMKTYHLDNPLIHPKYVIEDNVYSKKVMKILGITGIRRVTRKIEGIIRRIIFAEKGEIKKMFKKVFKRK